MNALETGTHLKDEPKAIRELCKILPGNFVLKLINSKHTLYISDESYNFVFGGGDENE